MNQSLDTLSDNMEQKLASNLINAYYYSTDNFKNEIISAAGDAGLTFSGKTTTLETSSMMRDAELHIS